MTPALFVYGTLMPEYEAWPRLAKWATGVSRADAVPGALYDTGRGYPAATFSAGAPGFVHGVVVDLDPARADAAWSALDRYEGEEYERITVRTCAGLDVVTYDWVAPRSGYRVLPDGRWPAGR